MKLLDTVIHRWLRVPYTLHVSKFRRPRKGAPLIVFVHGIGNSGLVWHTIIDQLPENVGVMTVDLLGFGQSPGPRWATYNVNTQARSLLTTILKRGVTSPVILVGHSLGTLVGIEFARRYPIAVRQLLLCSPPLYKSLDEVTRLSPESSLRALYRLIRKRPNELIAITKLALRLKLINESFDISTENVPAFMATLESSIINQDSLRHALNVTKPTTIVVGRLDPLVVMSNLKLVANRNPNVTLKVLPGSHDVIGAYRQGIANTLNSML